MGTVPEIELQKSFDRAFADHASNFPISAYDIKTGYESILRNAEVERDAARQKLIDDAVRIAVTSRFECPDCFNTGWRYVADPQGSSYRGVVRCDRCNTNHFRSQDYHKK